MSKSNRKQRPTASQRLVEREKVDQLIDQVFGGEMHAQRVASLANGVDGVFHAAQLGIRAIGSGLAVANGLIPRHAIKQIDRLFSNTKLSIEDMIACWVKFVVAERDEIVLNFDWTEFDHSDQSMIVLGMQTNHGRCTPLAWKTVVKSELKGQRNTHEDALLSLLHRCLLRLERPVKVTVVADRGFGDTSLYELLQEELGFDYIIRFRGTIQVESERGEVRKAHEWTGQHGRMRVLRSAHVTAQRHFVPIVVCVRSKNMKDTWCLASNRVDLKGSEIKKQYGKRFTIEESFRDLKNPRLGLGLKQVQMLRCDRRDRLFMLAVLAHTLMVLLGAAARELGLDRWLGASRIGGMSLFRMGQLIYDLIPRMKTQIFASVMKCYDKILIRHTVCQELLGVI
jgi:hypothetical protein